MLDWKAIAKKKLHPTQVQILEALQDEKTTSPSGLGVELGHPLGSISYHFKALRDDGFVEVVQTVPRRGAVEHRYRITSEAVKTKRKAK